MSWNLFLALIPLGLSFQLFKGSPRRSPLWWLGVFTFVAFLPNAPYVLTDLIHLVREITYNPSLWFNTVIVIPKYVVFLIIGFGAYVLSLVNLGYYLHRQGWGRYIQGTELSLHGLSAIGVYLGRFERLNSWYFVTKMHIVVDTITDSLQDKRPLLVILITFLVIMSLYWLSKQVVLALVLRRHYAAALQEIAQLKARLKGMEWERDHMQHS